MSSNDKKIWKRPEVKAFKSAEDAIAYYSERGMTSRLPKLSEWLQKRIVSGMRLKPRRALTRR